MTTTTTITPDTDSTGATSAGDTLAALADATAAAVDADPRAGQVRPSVRASLVPGTATEVSVRTGSHGFTIDEPAALGGTNRGANPVEHLLAALGACQVISYQVWAAKLGVRLDEVDVELAGDLDIRGFFGLDPDVRPGFSAVEVDVRLSGPEAPERYEELSRVVERHCPVLDNLGNPLPVRATVAVA